jgi:phage gp29-like protein
MALMVYTSKDNLWREYVNPLRGLTMERIVSLIEQGERGAFADLQWFYQAMERSDAIIATVLMRRRAALLACQWDVKPEDNPTDTVLACEQAAFLRDRYDRVENLREAVAFLASATFRGFSHVEKHYSEDGRGIVRLEPVEQWFWCRNGMFGGWTYNREARSGLEKGEKIERNNFVVVESPIALDRILAVQYFRRNLALRDWSSFLDVYGIPSVFFVGPPGVTEEKEKEYLAIAQELVKDGRGYLPNGTDVKYVNGGNSGKPPFRDHLDYLDKQITLLGTGGLLTMLTESGSGTLAGSAHQEAFDQVAKADAVMVAEALQRDFDKPLLATAFPGWPVEAGFELRMGRGAAVGSMPASV